MTYERFENVPVWQTAAELYEAVEVLLENDAFQASRGFRDRPLYLYYPFEQFGCTCGLLHLGGQEHSADSVAAFSFGRRHDLAGVIDSLDVEVAP